jgi:hypothetical protein
MAVYILGLLLFGVLIYAWIKQGPIQAIIVGGAFAVICVIILETFRVPTPWGRRRGANPNDEHGNEHELGGVARGHNLVDVHVGMH